MRPRRVRSLIKPAVAAAAAWAVLFVFNLPDVAWLKRSNPKTTAFIELYKEGLRSKGKKPSIKMTWRRLDDISPLLRGAVVIAEDDMFYQHHGVDWDSLKSALQYDWAKLRLARGASTITQQVARNLFLSPSKNPLRKLKEMLLARRLESTLTKSRILEIYLNVAEWGPGIYGAEAACQEYFHKSASQATLDEALSLAAALPSPKRWSPFKQKEKGKLADRKENILERMRQAGYLEEAWAPRQNS